MASNQPQQSGVVTKEYYVKVPKTTKRFHALKFHIASENELTWNKPEMLREANQFSIRQEWEQLPKFGAGSEFNRENKELSRRKKFGWATRKQSLDDLPWLLTFKDENSKDRTYKGKKSVTDNSSYYVFIHNTDGGFDAHPIEDWYSFAPHRTYRTLNIDEAEEEFSKRHKILNKYAIMANKRKGENGEGPADEEEKKSKRGGGGGKAKREAGGFSLTGEGEDDEMGGGGGDGDGEDGDGDEDRDDDDLGTERKKDKKKARKRAAGGGGGDDDENMQLHEDSDDGDEDGREQDYDDDDINTDDDDNELLDPNKVTEEEIGIDQEEAIISLQRDEDLDDTDDGENEDDENDDGEKLTAEGKEYKKLMKMKEATANKEEDDLSKDSAKKSVGSKNDSFGSDSSNSSDMDPDNDPTVVSTLLLDSKKKPHTSFSGLLPQSDTSSKRKATDDVSNPITKRSMTTSALTHADLDDGSSSSLGGTITKKATSASTSNLKANQTPAVPLLPHEDEVRKYLQRKPMTTKEILLKLKKRSTVSKEKLYENLSAVLKKLTDSKLLKIEDINGVKYLSLIK